MITSILCIVLATSISINIYFFSKSNKKHQLPKQQSVKSDLPDVPFELYRKYEKTKNIPGEYFKPDLKNAIPNDIFYNKKVVLTGDLQNIARVTAAQHLHKLGADIDTAINQRTNIVIIGEDPGPKKMAQIDLLNSTGSNIRVIYEKEFTSIIAGFPHL